MEPQRPDVRRVGVVGTGTMALGIAEVVAGAGVPVTVRARSKESAGAFRERLRAQLERQVGRGSLDSAHAEAILARVVVSEDLGELADAEVVIESIVEALEPKRVLFAQLATVVSSETLLATNTSTLSVGQIAQICEHPERVVGLHFFNPVPRMGLVEVVRALQSAPWAIEAAVAFVTSLGKTPIVVADEAGFVVNAVLFPAINAAVRLVERGVASVEDVDRAMVLGAHHPMGPLALADLVGLDVTVAILERLWAASGDPGLVPAPTLRRMVAAGRLGRKTGWGFYRYEESA